MSWVSTNKLTGLANSLRNKFTTNELVLANSDKSIGAHLNVGGQDGLVTMSPLAEDGSTPAQLWVTDSAANNATEITGGTMSYVTGVGTDDEDWTSLSLVGDVVNVSGKGGATRRITNVADPVNDNDAVNKKYVSTVTGGWNSLALSDITVGKYFNYGMHPLIYYYPLVDVNWTEGITNNRKGSGYMIWLYPDVRVNMDYVGQELDEDIQIDTVYLAANSAPEIMRFKLPNPSSTKLYESIVNNSYVLNGYQLVTRKTGSYDYLYTPLLYEIMIKFDYTEQMFTIHTELLSTNASSSTTSITLTKGTDELIDVNYITTTQNPDDLMVSSPTYVTSGKTPDRFIKPIVFTFLTISSNS